MPTNNQTNFDNIDDAKKAVERHLSALMSSRFGEEVRSAIRGSIDTIKNLFPLNSSALSDNCVLGKHISDDAVKGIVSRSGFDIMGIEDLTDHGNVPYGVTIWLIDANGKSQGEGLFVKGGDAIDVSVKNSSIDISLNVSSLGLMVENFDVSLPAEGYDDNVAFITLTSPNGATAGTPLRISGDENIGVSPVGGGVQLGLSSELLARINSLSSSITAIEGRIAAIEGRIAALEAIHSGESDPEASAAVTGEAMMISGASITVENENMTISPSNTSGENMTIGG